MVSTNTISRTVRICRWQARVNSLWLWAYCVLALAMHGYLMYRAVSRCKDYNELPWRTQDKPVVELYVYIALIVLSVMCVPFFIITSIFRIGNYAGDGVRFGRDNIHEQELAEAAAMATIPVSSVVGNHGNGVVADDTVQAEARPEVTSRRGVGSTLQRLWRHVGPFSHGFHVISAFSLLLPSMLLEAQEIKYGFRNPENSWLSDLDWMFGWHTADTYNTNRPPPNIVLEYTPVDSTSPNSLGGAAKSLGGTSDGTAPSSDGRVQNTDVISPEFINYIVALAFYCVRYAAVFWYTKMSFSIVFLFQLSIIIVHFAFSFCGAAILYKIRVNSFMFTDLRLALPPVATLSVYLAANFFLLLATLTVFNYGHQHYNDRWQKFLQSYAPMYCRHRKRRRGYHSYTPHTMASIVLLLVILCRGGIVYDYVIIYRKTGLPIILTCIVIDAMFMISWIAIWFALTLKQKWDFQIMFARYVMPTPPRHTTPVKGHGPPRRNRPASEHVTSPEETPPYEEPRAVTSVSEFVPPTPNGKVLNIDVDTTDAAASDLQSPGGVLRKSNARRSTSTQRVKFDASADVRSPKDKVIVGQTVDGNGSSNNNGRSTGPDGNLRRAYSDSTSRGRNRGKDSSSDDYVTDSTPENTLTRKYRHSIRDTCGLYFRISRDMSPSPAAHSSPRPVEKRPDNKHASSPTREGHPIRKEELILNPLKADKLYPANHSDSGNPSSSELSNSYSPGEGSTLAMPLSYSPNDSGVQLRRGHPDRGRPDERYSYPLTSPPEGWPYGEHERASRGQPPSYSGRDVPARHSLHLDRPRSRVHDGSFSANHKAEPHRKSRDPRDPIPWSPDGPARPQHDTVATDRPKTPPLPPRPPRNIPRDYPRGYRNSRDLRIVPKKAELSNRDSALPSSNETSSNDSNDVLCSQV